jgi:hypothetical protein
MLRRRRLVLGIWLAVLIAGGFASTRLSGLLSNDFGVPGTDSAQAQSILQQRFGDRSDGEYLVVFRVTHAANRPLLARLQQTVDRAATVIPTARAEPLRAVGDHVRHSRLSARPCASKGVHDCVGASGGPTEWSARLRQRPGGDPARSRPDLWPGPAAGRVRDRDSGRAFGVAVGAGSFPDRLAATRLGRGHDRRHAGDRLPCRACRRDADLRNESRRTDRPRARDRLLAADRFPLPRGAGRGQEPKRGGGADDGDGWPLGRLLRRDGGGRARAPASYSGPVRALTRHRRLSDSARLDRRGTDAAAGPAVAAARSSRPPAFPTEQEPSSAAAPRKGSTFSAVPTPHFRGSCSRCSGSPTCS